MPTLIHSDCSIPAAATRAESELGRRQWFALYTLPRHEKQVSKQLEQRFVECFLPLYGTVRRWKTGLTRVSLPLFPGYVFVHVADIERRKIFGLSSVLNIVGNRSGPISLPSEEIERLRVAVASGLAEPHPYLKVGSRVRIMHGPLTGTEGILKRKHGSLKVVLSVEMIMKSVAVTVNSSDVEPCSAPLSVTRHSVYGMSA